MKYKKKNGKTTTIYEVGTSTQRAIERSNKLTTVLIIILFILIIIMLLIYFNTGIIGNNLNKIIC